MEALSGPFRALALLMSTRGKKRETLILAREKAPDGDMKAGSSHQTQLTVKAGVSLGVVGSVCRDVGIVF